MIAPRLITAQAVVLLSAVGCAATPPYRPPAQPIVLRPKPLPAEVALPPFKSVPVAPVSNAASNAAPSAPPAAQAAVPATPRVPASAPGPGAAVPLAGFRPMRSAPRPADSGL